jgi:hypothetical protein
MDESKLIFFTGAPGSKWSATAHILSHNKLLPVNTSDYSKDRTYTHPAPSWTVSHLGAYWGPGFGLGEQFDKINQLSKDEILSEIDKPYTDKNWEQYRIIKCHQFALNLDWIKENFPTSKIMIVLRPNRVCSEGWLTAGGWDITYPNYRPYYKDDATFKKLALQELQAAKTFIDKHDLEMQVVTQHYWRKRWGITKETEELEKYINSIEKSPKGVWHYDTTIAEI